MVGQLRGCTAFMSVVCCKSQVTSHPPHAEAVSTGIVQGVPSMSALDELSQSITRLAGSIAPSVVGIGSRLRGSGGRRIGGSLEHTAPLAPGSSGGPLLDADGHLVGLNTNRLGEGFYLALPADAALRGRVEALGRGESVSRPRLGIAVAPSRVASHLRQSVGLPARDGVLVREV